MERRVVNRIAISPLIFGLIVAALLLLTACASAPTPVSETTAPTVAPEQIPAETPVADTTNAETAGTTDTTSAGDAAKSVNDMNAIDLATAVSERTPVPTQTPGILDREISEFMDKEGLTDQTLLGIPIDGWIDLVVTAIVVLLSYVILTVLFRRTIRWLAKRTSTQEHKQHWRTISTDGQWLILLLLVRNGILRLGLFGDGFRTLLNDITFVVSLFLITKIILKVIDIVIDEYRSRLAEQAQDDEGKKPEGLSTDDLHPLIMAFHRMLDLLVVITAVSVGLTHFGLDFNAFFLALVLIGFILSFGAKDIVTDAISGLVILVDQPFRPGDAILIKDLDTWGDVVDIGQISTRLRTADQRMVTVPNSRIVQSEVVNYTYPEPLYRAKTEIRIGYDTDMETVRSIITDAVRQVEGVLADRPVDVLFMEYGESTRLVDVRWWLHSIHDRYHMLDKINSAVEAALDQANIKVPYTTYALQVQLEGQEQRPTQDSQRVSSN